MAKAYGADAYRRVAGAGTKLHGGIGFTWDQTCGLPKASWSLGS
jgi:alkylation response protein AidB-like acyl-CoA dehydrogenase